MKRILIHNQKGGVGKTTTAANLGAALARRGGGRVVVADLDPQMHLTAMLAPGAGAGGWTVADWLAGRPGAPLAVAGEASLSLIPGAPVAAPQTAAIPDLPADWLILDTSPHWDDGMAEAARAADLVICPLEPDFLGLSGANRLLQTLNQHGIGFDRIRFLICRYDVRLAIHREVRTRLEARFGGGMLLPFVIHSSVKLAEAPGHGRTIFGHAPASTGAADYTRLADALLTPEDTARRIEG